VKVFVDLTRFAASATRTQLRDRVTALEDVGATGVTVSDHIFFTSGGRPRTEGVGHGCDPLTTLAAVAGLSERLEVQTVVANSAWIHPALLLRQFAQLAVVLGGERVTAGLGAGRAPRSSMRSASSCPASVPGSTGSRRSCVLRGGCGATDS
jgi:alkanesulfonate monooxygenase SsuD/methylene tetrahydromethanopterin reductase-like flavin-dependent oxidoreductase (luciferase family)